MCEGNKYNFTLSECILHYKGKEELIGGQVASYQFSKDMKSVRVVLVGGVTLELDYNDYVGDLLLQDWRDLFLNMNCCCEDTGSEPIPDYELACASTDGRLIKVDVATGNLSELDGSAVTDGATAVKCDKDIEEVRTCRIVNTGGIGYSINDVISHVRWYDTGTNPPSLFAEIFVNETTGISVTNAVLADSEPCKKTDEKIACVKCYCYPRLTTSVTIGDNDDLTAGSNWQSGLSDLTFDPLEVFTSVIDGSYPVIITPSGEYQHRDHIGGNPYSGTQRTIKAETPVSQNGALLPVRGLETVGGGTASPNSIVHKLSTPAAAWGADLLDLESNSLFLEARIVAYDSAFTVLSDNVILPTGMDAVKFVGVTSDSDNIAYVAVIVGDENGGTLSEQFAMTNIRTGYLGQQSSADCDVKEITKLIDGSLVKEYYDTDSGNQITDQVIIDSLEECEKEPIEVVVFTPVRVPICDTDTNESLYQQFSYLGDELQPEVLYFDADGEPTMPPINFILGYCSGTVPPNTDFEDTLICVNGKNSVLRTYTNTDTQTVISQEFRDETGVIAAPATWSYGACTVSSTPTIVEVIRLDGSLAVAATPFVNFAGGSAGNTYILNVPFKSFACAWLKDTDDDAEFEINDIGYRAGQGSTAGYSTVLPQLDNDGGIEMHTGTYVFTVNSGAFVEIIITR